MLINLHIIITTLYQFMCSVQVTPKWWFHIMGAIVYVLVK